MEIAGPGRGEQTGGRHAISRPVNRRERGLCWTQLVLPVFCLSLIGCESDRASELPVWSPEDHDNQANPAPGQVDTTAERPGMPDLSEHGINDVILATWKQNCTPCHGLIGRGDGPKGPMLHPPDLTNPAWHKQTTDAQILATIKGGRGQMPAFGYLPDATVHGLMSLVRMLNPERSNGTAEAAKAADRTGAESTGRPGSPQRQPSAPPSHPAPSPNSATPH